VWAAVGSDRETAGFWRIVMGSSYATNLNRIFI
jgi:hypothetical protein